MNEPEFPVSPRAAVDAEADTQPVAGWSLGAKIVFGAVALALAATFTLLAVSANKQADTMKALAAPDAPSSRTE